MSKDSKVKPRKEASQKRSKVTVSSILTATTQLLSENGLKGLTTAKIVERAGVSVGSMYQYFPNKDSILNAIVEKSFTRDVDILIEKIHQLDSKNTNLQQAVKELVTLTLTDFKQQSKVRKELVYSIVSLSHLKFTLSNDERISSTIIDYLKNYEDELDVTLDLKVVTFILQYMMKGLKFGMMFSNKEEYTQRIIDYSSKMIYAFLAKKAPE